MVPVMVGRTATLPHRARHAFAAQWNSGPQTECLGVDPTTAMIEAARALAPRGLHFEVAPAEWLPFDAGYFDLVFSTLSFHHWADRPGGLREVARVLRPGGVFVLADFVLDTLP